MGGVRWSEEDTAYLAENYNVLPVEEVAEELGRTVKAVFKKSYEIGITNYKLRPWKMKELRFLEENADKMMAKEIAQHLGRTVGSVLAKAAHVGLQFTSVRKHHRDEDVALVLGMHKAGVPVKEIALKMDMSLHTVRSFLYVPGRNRQLTPAL